MIHNNIGEKLKILRYIEGANAYDSHRINGLYDPTRETL